MAELNLEVERAEFEAEVRKVNSTSEIMERWPGGAYKHHGMEGRWQGWLMARRAAPSSPVADDGLPELPQKFGTVYAGNYWTIFDKACLPEFGVAAVYTADQLRQVQRDTYESGRVAGNRSREITEMLCNPQWGEPDLYSRLKTALDGEYELAQKHGKADVWAPVAHSLIDYLTAKKEDT